MHRFVWALAAIVIVVVAAMPAASPQSAGGAPGSPRVVRTGFVPSRDGFAFRNPRPNPTGTAYERFFSGRCGGMTYAALDRYAGDTRAAHPASPDAPEIVSRSADSIVANAARFALWSAWPQRSGEMRIPTLGALTRREELPKLVAALESGPVALGLVRARGVAEIGRNHQVVAHAVRVTPTRAVVAVYDSCQPGNDRVRLVIDLEDSNAPVREYASGYLVATWRGVFVERYTPPTR